MAIYLHEIITIDKGGKEAYLEALRTGFVPYLEESRGMRLVWAGSTVGSTAHWPETMAVFELRDFAHYAEVCDRMYTESSDDARLREIWQGALPLRLRSRSQTLVPASFSPSLDHLAARGVCGTAFAFSTYDVAPGRMPDFLDALERRAAIDARRGRTLVGAYEVAFTPTRAFAIWAHAGFAAIGAYEKDLRDDPLLREWWPLVDGVLEEFREEWAYAVPWCPLWPRNLAAGERVW
jgi:NIPSNAP protein